MYVRFDKGDGALADAASEPRIEELLRVVFKILDED